VSLPLDRLTLEVVLVAVTGLMTLMMANVWLTNRDEPGVRTWFAATVGGFIVFGVIAGLDAGADGAATLFGARNVGSFLLSLALLAGVMEFRGISGPRWRRALGGIGAVVSVALIALHAVVRIRLVVFDVSAIAAMAGLATAIVWRAPEPERRALRFGTIAPLGMIGVLAMRLWMTLQAGPDTILPDPDAQNAVFLMTALFNITMTHTATLVLYQRAQARTTRLAMEDPLTGLPNRRAFDDRLGRELARSTRTLSPFALILADVNDLKRTNDRHGHRAGDQLISAVGDRLRAVARETDVAARLGGDEFGLLLTGVADDRALAAAVHRVREALEGEVDCGSGLRIDLRVSLGGALWGAPEKARDALLGSADQSLYADKARSRLKTATG
jgi:diguanylate cyclase (GGDEF)-like protein